MQDKKLTPEQINRILGPAKRAPLSQVYKACIEDGSGSVLRMMRKINYLKIKELEQLYYDNLSASNCPIDIEWELLTEIVDNSLKIKALNAFVQKYARDCSDEAELYMEKASELFGILAEEIAIHKDWVNAMHENTIVAYKNFITQHPNSRYQNEAEITIRTLKKDLLKDMKRNPCGYYREVVHDFIRSGVLSYDELVVKEKLLSKEAFNHIRKYPHLFDEQTSLPIVKPLKIPYSKQGNTDIIFVGVSGSGGKTCLMASLMALLNQRDFLLSTDKDFDNLYAAYLADYMKANRLPPATDQSYVQVVNTLLKVKRREFGVSFIEYAGEQVADMAGNTKDEGFAPITPDIGGIFKNNNRKILFLAIDPTNNKTLQVGCDSEFWVYQSDVYEMLVSLLNKDRRFRETIIGIHIVITKKDLWGKELPYNSNLKDFLFLNGYRVVWENLCDLCKKNEIMQDNNYEPSISAFSIGKFMIGDTYSFDDRDARKIKDLICDDLSNHVERNSFKGKFRQLFNS